MPIGVPGSPIVSPRPAPVEPTHRVVTMDATHRCDACQAQAYVRTVSYNFTFEWCSHHYNLNVDMLTEAYGILETVDERWRLFEVAKLDVSG